MLKFLELERFRISGTISFLGFVNLSSTPSLRGSSPLVDTFAILLAPTSNSFATTVGHCFNFASSRRTIDSVSFASGVSGSAVASGSPGRSVGFVARDFSDISFTTSARI